MKFCGVTGHSPSTDCLDSTSNPKPFVAFLSFRILHRSEAKFKSTLLSVCQVAAHCHDSQQRFKSYDRF